MDNPKKKSNVIIPLLIIGGIIAFLYFKNKKTATAEVLPESDSSGGGGGGGGFMGGLFNPVPVAVIPVTPVVENPPAGTSQVTDVPEIKPVDKSPTEAELKAQADAKAKAEADAKAKAEADAKAKEEADAQTARNYSIAFSYINNIRRIEKEIYDLSKGIINNQEQIKINEKKRTIAEYERQLNALGYRYTGSAFPVKI